MNNKLKIDSDTYFICQRLQEIDEDYFVMFNLVNDKFEVHAKNQKGRTYCFTVPFPILDERTVLYALKTRSENRDNIISEIEKNNELLYNKSIQDTVKLLKEGI